MLPKEVISLAQKVREEVEVWVYNNPDIDQTDLCGACSICSYALYLVLKVNGYDPSYIHGWDTPNSGHFWVTLDGWVIDLTYTQFRFNANPVYIIKEADYDVKFSNIEKNPSVDRFISWHRQSPLYYENHINTLVESLTKSLTGVY